MTKGTKWFASLGTGALAGGLYFYANMRSSGLPSGYVDAEQLLSAWHQVHLGPALIVFVFVSYVMETLVGPALVTIQVTAAIDFDSSPPKHPEWEHKRVHDD